MMQMKQKGMIDKKGCMQMMRKKDDNKQEFVTKKRSVINHSGTPC